MIVVVEFENVKSEKDFEKVTSRVIDLLNLPERSWIIKLLN